MSAFALLTRNLDLSRLSDDQLAAIVEHQHSAQEALAALTGSLGMTDVPGVE
jgi:hypothetical protein